MKKLLNISVIAALAVLPLAANATPEYASAIPAEPVSATANTKVATTSYVQGAYNAAIAVANKESQRASAAEGDLTTLTTTTKTSLVGAINEINTTAGNAADQDLSNLSVTGTGVITSAVTSGAAGGTYSNTTSGLTATTIQGAIDEVAGSVATQGAKVLKVYTTWNTDTNQEITLTAPTQGS